MSEFEKFFWTVWNWLYKYLYEVLGGEYNEDYLVEIPE